MLLIIVCCLIAGGLAMDPCGLATIQPHTPVVPSYPVPAQCISQWHTGDMAALNEIFFDMNGPQWYINTNWTQWLSICYWPGVRCNNNCRVDSLILGANNVRGRLSDGILELRELRTLSMSDNVIPSGFRMLVDLPMLNTIDFDNCSVIESWPIVFGPNVTTIGFGHNNMSGHLAKWSLMPRLESIGLGGNRLTGTIPNDCLDLDRLESVFLEFNRLTGTIPWELVGLKRILNLDLAVNNLVGNVPEIRLPRAQIVDLSCNQLAGTIPSVVVGNIAQVYLNNNRFTGSIPQVSPSIGENPWVKMPVLELVDLSRNHLTGTIPTMDAVQIHVHHNNLTGDLPGRGSAYTQLIIATGNPIKWKGQLPRGYQTYYDLPTIINNMTCPNLRRYNLVTFVDPSYYDGKFCRGEGLAPPP